jgi:hypothetical protein
VNIRVHRPSRSMTLISGNENIGRQFEPCA